MTFGIIPACGHSTRMGRPKLSLPLGGHTVIEHVVAALRGGGVDVVLVVVGRHVPELEPLAVGAGAKVLALPEPTADMRATVEAGLAWVEERFHPAPDDWWLLAPGDHPTLSPNAVRQLLAATRDGGSIVVPVFDGRRGHPLLLRWSHADDVRRLPPGEGINALSRRHPDTVREVAVSDAGGLHDLDTPEDYERVRRPG
jgi:CTP:molybdopterin cytidylyltransferase MocA